MALVTDAATPSPRPSIGDISTVTSLVTAAAPELALQKWIMSLASQFLRSQIAPLELAVKDPLRDVRKQLRQLVSDLTLTPAQQEAFERVVACNAHFWDVSVNGSHEGTPPWNRPLALNMALLRVYHCHLAAAACRDALAKAAQVPPPLERAVVEEALRFARWMAAAYAVGSEHASEAELAERAAAVAAVPAAAIFASELSDATQLDDPLCPRFLIALDLVRGEVVLSVRGTHSLSDVFADLIGDAVPFAGGLAHDGICDAARRLQRRTAPLLRSALGQLVGAEPGQRRRLVLTGHSLGAGVASLLAMLLCGADVDDDGNDGKPLWRLPPDVDLATYLYAPPPVYGPAPSGAGAESSQARSAAELAMASGVAFAMNYDIIPRTSLHNGFKLFQQVRLVDTYLRWRKRDALGHLQEVRHPSPERSAQATAQIVKAVEAAIAEAVASAPAPPNPFPLQHPAVATVYHLVGAPGGTASFSVEQGLEKGSCSRPKDGGWLYKCSKVLGEWRRRWAWVADGELCFARTSSLPAKTRVQLTAGATLLTLLGPPSNEAFPASIVTTSKEAAEAATDEAEVSSCSTGSSERGSKDSILALPHKSLRQPTGWAFKVETVAVGGALPSSASSVLLCAESMATRDAWIRLLVAEVAKARRSCYTVQAAMPRGAFGREALLADGCVDDHQVTRYEAALEGILHSLSSGGAGTACARTT